MTIHIGGNQITDIKIGSQQINTVWIGGNKVWDRVVDTQTGVAGSTYVYMFGTYVGYSSGSANSGLSQIGSISDGTCDFKGGAVVEEIMKTPWSTVSFSLRGTHANSGFTKFTLNGQDFLRTDATFSQTAGETMWSWTYVSNPFASTGTITATWRS